MGRLYVADYGFAWCENLILNGNDTIGGGIFPSLLFYTIFCEKRKIMAISFVKFREKKREFPHGAIEKEK